MSGWLHSGIEHRFRTPRVKKPKPQPSLLQML
jgi:hypothetical protein